MKRIIYGEFKSYNANTRNKHVGDCAKRALTLAFGLDYNDVSAELNRLKREYRYSSFNDVSCILKFLELRNVQMKKLPDLISVEEFADAHAHGTFVVFTSDENTALRGVSKHMLCIIDGDVYDSWYSMSETVVKYGLVKDTDTALSSVTCPDIIEDVAEAVDTYIDKVNNPPLKLIRVLKRGLAKALIDYSKCFKHYVMNVITPTDDSLVRSTCGGSVNSSDG